MTRTTSPMVVLGLILALVAGAFPSSQAVRAYETQTVQVSEGGFNPATCQMNREFIRFQNVGNTPRRVIVPSVIQGNPPVFDTGYLEPGEISNSFSIQAGGQMRFFDADNMNHFVLVTTPVHTATWQVICTPDPTKQPPPPICRGNPHCLRVPQLALDG